MIRLLGDLWAVKDKKVVSVSSNCGDPMAAFANLETPLIQDLSASQRKLKAGPHIYGHPEDLNTVLKAFPYIKCLSLANNHTMDFGLHGLEQTISACAKSNVEVVGAGHDARSASSPRIIIVGGLRIGVLARCEMQFGISSKVRAGVAPFDITLHKAIRQLKLIVDIVIVTIHAAAELSPWPSPSWQNQLRALIDAGANVVHGHHSHVPQGYESYNSGLILYGLGNGLVSPSQWIQANTDWSLVLDLLIENDSIRPIVRISRLIEDSRMITVSIENIEEPSKYHGYLQMCNEPLSDRRLLEGIWQEVSLRMYDSWYAEWLGTPPLVHQHSRLAKWTIKSALKSAMRSIRLGDKYPSKSLSTYLLFACESHREVISTSLGILNEEIDDMRNEKTKNMVDAMMPWSKRV